MRNTNAFSLRTQRLWKSATLIAQTVEVILALLKTKQALPNVQERSMLKVCKYFLSDCLI